MTNSVGAPVAGASRKEALDVYLSFYRSTWAGGNRKVCKDAQVTAQARQVLTESEAEHRFNLLPFYPCVMEMMESRSGGPRVLLRLIRAAEILEMFCMNLLLFPWKKEFRTLKKFTGNFVYYVQPALPNQITRSILRHIGYDSENDSEYRLSENVDLNAVTQMGFELFLVRLECEHLLELLDQKSDAEGLEIVRKRATFLQSAKTTEEGPGRDAYRAGGGVLEEDGQRKDDLPPDPSPIQSLKPEVLDVKEPPKNSAEGGQRGFMCEDKSIMEMQESYPDLAFRQKPIFQNVNAKRKPDRRKDVQTKALSNDMSGPQGIALHAELPRKLQIPECSTEEKQPVLLRNKQALKTVKNNDDPLNELTEKLDRLKLKEPDPKEPLKFPIEETALPQAQTQAQLKRNEPIVCSLSQESVCNISDCSSCPVTARLQTNDGITEPPHSFYIPNCQDCRSGLAPPVEHDENSRIREPEENLDQTYSGGI